MVLLVVYLCRQEYKGTEIIMPTYELLEAADRIELYAFAEKNKIKEEIIKVLDKMI